MHDTYTDTSVHTIFQALNDLTQMVNFPFWIPDCDSHSPALLDLFWIYFSLVQICRTVGPSVAASLEPLTRLQNVASLSLFYRYYFGKCLSDLAQLVQV